MWQGQRHLPLQLLVHLALHQRPLLCACVLEIPRLGCWVPVLPGDMLFWGAFHAFYCHYLAPEESQAHPEPGHRGAPPRELAESRAQRRPMLLPLLPDEP